METEIKMLKTKEVQQQKNSKGYETLLADKIPLNEHFLALKNKFNTERDEMQKKYQNDNKRLEQQKRDNKTLKEAIQTSTSEVNKLTQRQCAQKDQAKKEIRDQEQKKTLEDHTIVTLKAER